MFQYDFVINAFIAAGIVLPATVLCAEADGQCRVEVLGQEALVRCRPGEKPRSKASICVRGSELEAVEAGRPGIDGTVRRAVYKGGSARLEFVPSAAPDRVLHFDQPDPGPFTEGAAARLAIKSGWLIPASAS